MWEAIAEGNLTYQGLIRVLLSVAAGPTEIDASGSPVTVTFKDQSGTKDRVVAEMVGSERVAVDIDPD